MPTVDVLIVDDSVDICETMQVALQLEGFSVATASTAAEAIKAVSSLRPFVLLLDYRFPELDVPAFVQTVRKLTESEIILATAIADPSAKAKELHILHVLPKPFELEAACSLLRTLLHR
jgi:DNA-binding NtrC family response regulator